MCLYTPEKGAAGIVKGTEVFDLDEMNYICIEGVIGAGKTSLVKMLSERVNGRTVFEQAEENPFLSRFYRNRTSFAFQTQLWFLLSRYRQLTEEFLQQDLFHTVTIADYMFDKDRIFASTNLDENELALYQTVEGILQKDVPKPDFVVYLQTSTEVLMKRIEKRGRPYEINMDEEYIAQLNETYNQFFFHYSDSPLLIVNTNDIDFVHRPSDFEEIVNEMAVTKSGSHYFHPMGGRRGPEGRNP